MVTSSFMCLAQGLREASTKPRSLYSNRAKLLGNRRPHLKVWNVFEREHFLHSHFLRLTFLENILANFECAYIVCIFKSSRYKTILVLLLFHCRELCPRYNTDLPATSYVS